MNIINKSSRREFIKKSGVIIAAASACATAGHLSATEKKEEEVSPSEDLMREHGVLKRILLIYGEALRRMDANEDLSPEPLAASAKIIREFVEDYHEKLEENFLFPRFKKAGKLVDLVDVLLQQHQAGRRLTDITIHLATCQRSRVRFVRRRFREEGRRTLWRRRLFQSRRSCCRHRKEARHLRSLAIHPKIIRSGSRF